MNSKKCNLLMSKMGMIIKYFLAKGFKLSRYKIVRQYKNKNMVKQYVCKKNNNNRTRYWDSTVNSVKSFLFLL